MSIQGAALIEYRIPVERTRVIALVPSDYSFVLLVALTVSHDHERLQRLIKTNRAELRVWKPPAE